ncbi:MAG TPA: NAD+ synthase [bacterium]|nr:NAD+ synthase [bacterium]
MLRLALAQINVTVGDLSGNTEKIIHYINIAREQQVDVIAFPELAITGYPPEDLLLRPQFIGDNLACLQKIASVVNSISCIVGFVDVVKNKLYNSAALLHQHEVRGVYCKSHLPNYGVFDEKRYFYEGDMPLIFTLNGVRVGVSICEDLWIQDSVIDAQALIGGIDLAINISASPYCSGKIDERENLLIDRASKNRVKMAYINLIGGQDELVFDGSSLVVDESGVILMRCNQFKEDLKIIDLDLTDVDQIRLSDPAFQKRKAVFPRQYQFQLVDLESNHGSDVQKHSIPFQSSQKLNYQDEVYHALVLGARDYIKKNGFDQVVLGISGGIDSALTAVIAVDALGKENVIGVAMPSEFTFQASLEDARKLASNLGIEYRVIPIQKTFEQYQSMLQTQFANLPFDVTEENIQARIRGNIIMALSNKFGWLAITTGNKSELSVGYCTLYGDMAGGFAVIKDVPKTLVYQLCENFNRSHGREIIPKRTIIKPPSAELRPNQKDEDSLPPYSILDPILQDYIENNATVHQIVKKGFDEKTVRRVIKMVDLAEYKRRQAPPGIKITPRAFGRDRRMPITNKYH